ncbi:MAG: hypothetical protein KGY67_09110 [Candidatus Thermoplasmatota archaeon]|nr:hypothetical protein [Candidatus Thermoplasmatota archaeon]
MKKIDIYRKTRLVPLIITIMLFTVLISTDLVSAASGKAYSTDIDLGTQYITPSEGFRLVQEVEYVTEGTGDLMIDSFRINHIGTAYSGSPDVSCFEAVEIWADGGNGYYDRNIGRTGDDELIDLIEDPPNDISRTFGGNDDDACLVIPQGASKKVFVTVDIIDLSINNKSIILRLSAEDLVSTSPVQWASGEGLDICSSPTYIFTRATSLARTIVDSNDNGIVDQIIWNHYYLIDPATKIVHDVNEASTIEKFTVKYNENEVDIVGIEFYESNNDCASFVLLLDEEDSNLQVDTTSTDFTCNYDSMGDELLFENAEGRSVPVWPMPLFPINDGAGPVVTSLTVSDEMITTEDVGDTFEVVLSFSESMHTESFPVLDFDDVVHQGSSQMLIFDSGYWIDEETYQINYTIADEHMYAGNVDVICTTQGVYDVDAYGDAKNQMNSAYTKADLFTIDNKAPDISGFPTDTLNPGEDYTVRVDVTDGSDIQNVLLDYNFGNSWNTKTMNSNPSSDEYFAVITAPMDATTLNYKISAYDIHDNGDETSEKELLVVNEDEEEDDESEEEEEAEPEDEETEEQESEDDSEDTPEDQDSDDDGIPDEVEDTLGSDPKNDSDVIRVEELDGYLVDTDNDGEPDMFYEKSNETVATLMIGDDGIYHIDVNGDGTIDYSYNVTTRSITAFEDQDKPDSTPGFSTALFFISLFAIVILVFDRRKNRF